MDTGGVCINGIAEREASSLMRSWYLHPEFSSVGLYDWVHLGECTEYIFYRGLFRIIQDWLENDPARASELASGKASERPSLREMRFCDWRSFPALVSRVRGAEGQDSTSRPAVLTTVRPQNLAMIHALGASGVFDLVVEGNMDNLSAPLNQMGIKYEVLDTYLAPEVRSECDARVKELLPLWMKAIQAPSFQEQFSLLGKSLFREVRDLLEGLFHDQFPLLITYKETLKNLLTKRRIVLVLLWNDSLPQHRLLALSCQELGIPVLHVAHGVYYMEPRNEVIYADRVAVLGAYSRDKYIKKGNFPERIVTTGNPDWDKYRYMPDLVDRADFCSSMGLDAGKMTILFATFSSPDRSQTEVFFRQLLRAVSALGQRHPLQLAVKLHPSEWSRGSWYKRIAVEEGIDDTVVTRESLEELLVISDVVVCRASSNVELEAFFLGKAIVLSEGFSVFGEDLNVNAMSEGTELFGLLEKALSDTGAREVLGDKRKETMARYNYLNDGQATRRVLDVIEEMTGINAKIPSNFVPFLRLPVHQVSEKGETRQRPDSLLEQGDVADAKGDLDAALDLFQQALEMEPRSTEVLKRLCRALMKGERFEEASDKLSDLIRLDPGNEEAHLLYSLAALYQGQHAVTLDRLGYLLDSSSCDREMKALACLYAGRCSEAIEDGGSAERYYEETIRLDPDSKESYTALSRFYCNANRLDRAGDVIRRRIARDPKDIEAHNDLGVVLYQMDRVEEGITSLRKALELDPGYTDALFNLVEIERNRNNYPAALTLVENFLKVHPEHGKVRFLQKRLRIEARASDTPS